MKETRSDFWKCRQCGRIEPIDPNDRIQCCTRNGCGFVMSLVTITESSPELYGATNAEVLAAWLLAGDGRRREIEMASRPKEAGRYTQYVYTGIPTMSSESVIVREYLGNLCFGYIPETAKLPVNKTYGVLWEKL